MGGIHIKKSDIKKLRKQLRVALKNVQKNHWIIMSVIAVLLVFVFAMVLQTRFSSVPSDSPEGSTKKEEMVRDSLTGLWVYEQNMPRQVFGVMIDNHNDAKPQSGIDKAFLVIEAPVEANISRLLAFFSDDQEVAKIGPVRSARPYFIDWNNELDALYVHVGGSNQSLDEIASGGTFDLNEYWGGKYFWRASSRSAPHNTYTSSEELKSFADGRREVGKAPKLLYGIWKFKDPSKEVPENPKSLSVSFLPPYYAYSWEYNEKDHNYKRLQRGSSDKTLDASYIFADNIAVAVTDVETIDSVGRKKLKTIGTGKGYVFQDGIVIEGSWKKNSESERLRFYNEEEEEVVFNSGTTWIEIVPDEDNVTIK